MNQTRRRKITHEITDVNETIIRHLLANTIIHNKNISKEQEAEYYQKIQEWFEDINKIKYCKELLDVVTQCENLKIIFNFESELVNNAALYDCTSSGLPFTGGIISIGAKMSDTRREQEIKGVLARELCRYAICLTYENKSHPNYKHETAAAQQLSKIVETINKWTSEDTDRWNGIISSVIRTSTTDNIQMELIATAVQILVQFDDDKEELTRFEVKFKIIFDYFENFVLPEMKKLNLKLRENVRKFNKMADILPSILSLELELSELKDVKSLTANNFSIIQTNFPKLLLFNIQKCLQIDHGNLFDSKNVFVSAEKLESQELLDDYQNLLKQDPNLNIFVIYSRKIDENLENIFACKKSKFTLIVSDENQCEELALKLTELNLNPTRIKVNYGWNDLTLDSQKFLLQMKIKFQNNSEFSFLDILKDEYNPEDEEIVRNFSEIIDDQLLGLLMDNSLISVNSELENPEFFEVMFIKQEIRKIDKYTSPSDWISNSYSISISHEELLQDVQKKKFVLISGKPGSGKSWTMKNFAKILQRKNPTNWMTYVDLKQFTEEFKDLMVRRSESEFPVFFAESVLKLKSKFEVKVFKKMYEIGKVFIFLDGLDELGANCAELVSKLLKSFESNEGSQLWIATRDNIEVDLNQMLELNVKYKLDKMSEENCVNLIATSWMLSEIKANSEDKSNVDVKSCDNFNSYQKLAKDLLVKNSISKFRSIGSPQCCKMIADITKDDKTSSIELTELNIFRKFTQYLYNKWTSLRNSGTENQELNFLTIHEIIAMKSLFPNYSDFCDLNLEDLKVWSDKDITSGGLVTKNGHNFVFLHETVRDFFVAEFILRMLKKEEISSWFFPFLMKVLTTRIYNCIRMFLNQGLLELKLSDKTVKMITANLDEYTNISYIFMENLENLQKLIVKCLSRRRYKVVKNILVSNLDVIFMSFKNADFPINPQIFLEFLVKFLNAKCLQELINKKNLFSTIIDACEDLEPFEKFVNSVKIKLGVKFVVQNFKNYRRSTHPNILFTLIDSKNLNGPKIQKFLKILRGFLNVRQVMELMQVEKRNYCRNILNEAIQRRDSKLLKDVWIEIENFFKANENHGKFKELITQEASEEEISVIQFLAYSQDIKFHEVFWDLALRTFSQEELKNFINSENNYFFKLFELHFSNSDDFQAIEFTFEKLQKILNEEQFHEIMTADSQTRSGNLLYGAAEYAGKLKSFELIWKLTKKVYKSDEIFLDFVCNLDSCGSKIFDSASRNTNHEIFEFILSELERNVTRDKIRSLLANINNKNQNILHNINYPNIFSTVWNAICVYLNSSEILEILQNCDCNGNNFILKIINRYSSIKNFHQEIWNAVKEFINHHEVMSTDVIENIQKCEKLIENLNERRYEDNGLLIEYIKLKWLKTKILRLLDCPESLRLEITKSGLFSCAYDFYVLANCEDFKIHEISWEFILKKYENREDLVNLMTRRSVHGSIFIHSIMSNKNVETVKFVFDIIQSSFNQTQIREILSVKCSNEVNFLFIAVRDSKNVKIIQLLWNFYQKYFNSTEIFNQISQTIESSCNILLYAAKSSADVFKFIWDEINQLCNSENEESNQKLLELVTKRTYCHRNILRICIEQFDVELLKVVWTEVKNFLGGSLKSVVKLVDRNNQTYRRYNDILDIIEVASKSDKIEFHEVLWELLWDTFRKYDELKSLIMFKNEESDESTQYTDYELYQNTETINNFIINFLKSTNLNVIKLTMRNFNKIFTKDEICKFLIFRGNNSNFLVSTEDCIERHQLLWDIYHQYLTIADVKNFSQSFYSQILCNSATISIEIFKFTWNKVLKEAEDILIPVLENYDHIICACINHKDKELLKIVWTEVKKFYKIQNMPESFKEFIFLRNFYKHIFKAVSEVNEFEFHETFWELLLMTFENHEEFKNILIRKNQFNLIFISEITKNKDINVVKFLVKILQENFTDNQLQEMIQVEPNLLHYCINGDKDDPQTFEIWWKFVKKVFQISQNFVEFLKVKKILELIFGHANEQILEFIFNDLETFMTCDEIKENLININNNHENILHIALKQRNNFKNTWQYIHKYLSKQEISRLLMKSDENGMNFLFHVISNYSVEIVDITWNEMKKVLSYDDQIKCLKDKNPEKLNLYHLLWIEKIFREYKIRLNK